MSGYQPTSRRPIADTFRRTAHGAVRLCVVWNVHPDAISYLSIVASVAAALFFWRAGVHPWLLVVAPAFCYLRLWFNMLDGMVALASGKASWRGEILNDLPDRVSDVLVFVGVAHSGLCSPFSGYWAAIMSVLTAYVGMFGQAVKVQREFGGIMAKPWRMVALHLGAWSMAAVGFWSGKPIHFGGQVRSGEPTILDWTCALIVIGCVQTITVRLARIFRALKEKEAAR